MKAVVGARTCSLTDCDRPHYAKGYCNLHWSRLRQHGDPAVVIGQSWVPAIERFWARVDQSDGCWLWLGQTDKDGYGLLSVGGRPVRAHRWSYEHFVGPIPEGLVIDHLCRSRGCVNPSHLEPVTTGENTRRGILKTHCIRGHAFTTENTYLPPKGGRQCRACNRINAIRRRSQ